MKRQRWSESQEKIIEGESGEDNSQGNREDSRKDRVSR